MSSKSTIRLTFYGAAETVTGSKYLLEGAGKRILVDCGLFQGRKELRLQNWAEPSFEPTSLDAIVLTHAHIDHSGYLPLLVKRGYRGPIYCTEATAALLQLLLPDSAYLQEEEAEFANRHKTSKHHPALPLYAAEDAKQTLELLQPIEWHQDLELFPEIKVCAYQAGHILGAAILNFNLAGKRITFSGDIGRYDDPLLPDPSPVELGEVVLCESTYGNRLHGILDVKVELQRVVRRAVQQSGPLIIPSFAVGRTQELLYYLSQLEKENLIPVLPVFVDSPMAVDATEIYRRFSQHADEKERGPVTFRTRNTTFCRTSDESKKLNNLQGARIIISASGMVTGGRILHHLSNWLDKPETTVLFVGYQAEGTRGRTIESRARDVKIFGRYVEIRARVETVSGLSAHGDRDELLRWLKSCSGNPKIVKIVHGEVEAARYFAACVQKELNWNASTAEQAQAVEW